MKSIFTIHVHFERDTISIVQFDYIATTEVLMTPFLLISTEFIGVLIFDHNPKMLCSLIWHC